MPKSKLYSSNLKLKDWPMITVLNIALVLTTLSSTLIAFGGETCLKGSEPLFTRITKRGWLALFTLLVATLLGVGKEVLSFQEDRSKDLAQNALKLQLTSASSQLTELKAGNDRLGESNKKLQDDVAAANQALASDSRVTNGIASVEKQINSQVQLANENLGVANQSLVAANSSLSKSGELLNGLGSLEEQVREATLLTALSKQQSRLDMDVDVDIHPLYLNSLPIPNKLNDLLFPAWKTEGPQDEKALLSSFDITSAEGPNGTQLRISVSTFRKHPEEQEASGSVRFNTSPFDEGTETGTGKIIASVKLAASEAGDPTLQCHLFVPSPQTLGQWVSVFRKQTALFQITYLLREDINEKSLAKLNSLWNDMFGRIGSVRIPLLDQGNFTLIYELRRGDIRVRDLGTMKELSVAYLISSAPKFEISDL